MPFRFLQLAASALLSRRHFCHGSHARSPKEAALKITRCAPRETPSRFIIALLHGMLDAAVQKAVFMISIASATCLSRKPSAPQSVCWRAMMLGRRLITRRRCIVSFSAEHVVSPYHAADGATTRRVHRRRGKSRHMNTRRELHAFMPPRREQRQQHSSLSYGHAGRIKALQLDDDT